MLWRKFLAAFLVVVAASPAWGAAEPLGSITSTSETTVRDTKLTAGSTVFSGDVISVGEHGTTQIALSGGAQAEVVRNSSLELSKADGKTQLIVNRGQASFRTSGNSGISAVVADATVRPMNGAETSAVIQSLSETHVIVAAQKGALLVTTAFDGKTYTLHEGEAAELSAVPESQQGGGAAPAGRAVPAMHVSKRAVIWTVVIVGSAAAVTAYLLARGEKTPSTTQLQNEISPHKLN